MKVVSTYGTSPLRIMQFLLRDADAATESPRALVEAAAEWGADTVLLNAGGFSAWYPTDLPYQLANPYLQPGQDFFGEALASAHALGLRVYARVDVSKVQPMVAEAHPDWLRRTEDGAVSTEWEMPETCFTGPYWQACNAEIVREMLGRYPVDGVFYNMYRIPHCHCARCQEVLKSEAGIAGVPTRADPADPSWRRYERWRRARLAAYTRDLRDLVHALRPDTALLVYHHQKEGWDVRAMADATDVVSVTASLPLALNPLSPQPAWVGWPGYEAALARGLKPDRAGMVVTTTSALFASRRASQPADRVRAGMLQVAFQRGAPCPALPGGLNQEDPRALAGVQETLDWLRRYDDLFGRLQSCARIALLSSRDTLDLCPTAGEGELARREEWGIYLALTRAGYPFDVVPLGADLDGYALAFLPDAAVLDDEDARSLDDWVALGGSLVATHLAGQFDGDGEARERSPLRCLGEPRVTANHDLTGAYLDVANPALRAVLGGTSVLGVERQLLALETRATPVATDLRLIGPLRNNTPELALLPPVAEDAPPGLLEFAHGRGRAWHLPWRPGVLWGQTGLPDAASVLAWLAERAVSPAPVQLSAAAGVVEARLWRVGDSEQRVVFLLNGAALQHSPLTEVTPLGPFDILLAVPPGTRVIRARSFARDEELPIRPTDPDADTGCMVISLPGLGAFDALLIDCQPESAPR